MINKKTKFLIKFSVEKYILSLIALIIVLIKINTPCKIYCILMVIDTDVIEIRYKKK